MVALLPTGCATVISGRRQQVALATQLPPSPRVA